MNERFMPSLEHIVLVKIASTLWSQQDIRVLLVKYDGRDEGRWDQIENKVGKKVSMFPQPQPLKEKILSTIKPIGLQIQRWWKNYKRQTFDQATNWPNKFYFTPQGTLDRQKTAKILMRDHTIDLMERYYMACYHCLQDDVKRLWQKMTENGKNPFERTFYYYVRHKELSSFLTYNIYEGKVAKMEKYTRLYFGAVCTPYQWAFERGVKALNPVAVEYFFNKLTPLEREASLRDAISYSLRFMRHCCEVDGDFDSVGDILCFLLSQSNGEQQLKLIEMYPREILKSFLQWPRQGLFIGMTNQAEVFLEKEDHYLLLREIVKKVEDGYRDFDYRKLFREFWLKSDLTVKKYVINKHPEKKKSDLAKGNSNLLISLLEIRDIESISLILKDATVEEKENIFQNVGFYSCSYLSRDEDWDVIQFFLNEVISSRVKLIKFKDECEKSKCCFNKKFFQLLDENIQKWNEKRSEKEDNCTPTKRFCSSSNA